MPRPARWWVGMPANRTLSNSSLPVPGVKPMIVRSRVVLPAPLRPMSPANSPVSTSRSTLRRMATGPIDTDTPSSRSMRRLLASDIAAHVLHAEYILRRTIANDAAVVEGHHAAGKARDDIHVVLDENHPHAGIPRGTSAHLVSNGGVSLLEQEAAECRWPLDGSEQRFCGLPAQARSYCAQNAQRAVSDLEKPDP